MVYNSGVSRTPLRGQPVEVEDRWHAIYNQSNDLSDLPGRDGLGSAHDSSSHHLASVTDASAERQAPSLHRPHLQVHRPTASGFTNHRTEVLPGLRWAAACRHLRDDSLAQYASVWLICKRLSR